MNKEEITNVVKLALLLQKEHYKKEVARVLDKYEKAIKDYNIQLRKLITGINTIHLTCTRKDINVYMGRISNQASKFKLLDVQQSTIPKLKFRHLNAEDIINKLSLPTLPDA